MTLPLSINVIAQGPVWPSSRRRIPQVIPLSILDASVATFSPCETILIFNAPVNGATFTSDHLKAALERTLDSYPQWCGHLLCNGYEPQPNSHIYRHGRLFLSYGQADDPGVILIVATSDQSAGDIVPSGKERLGKLRSWDASSFPENALKPGMQLSTSNLDDLSLSSVAVQVTMFVCGGFAIAIKMAHPLSDAHCMAWFARDWATVSCAMLSSQEIPLLSPIFEPQLLDSSAAGNIDSPEADPQLVAVANRLPSHHFDYWISGEDCPYPNDATEVPADLLSVPRDPPGTRIPWSEWDLQAPVDHYVLHFSGRELTKIRREASTRASAATDVSHHDALLAHVWSCINRARELTDDDGEVYLDYTLGLRPRTNPPLSARFVGSPIINTAVTTTGHEAATAGLPAIASLIRSTVAQYTTENVAALLHAKIFEQSPVRFWEAFLGRRHVLLTSWIHTRLTYVDFGAGIPRYVQAGMPPIDGLVQVMEATPVVSGSSAQSSWSTQSHWTDDGVDVHIYLTKDSMQRLLSDPLLRKYNVDS